MTEKKGTETRRSREELGGQAVIEGVLVRTKSRFAIAVRTPKGNIRTKIERHIPISRKNWFTRLPVVRGFFILLDALITGTRALSWSADQQTGKQEKITTTEMTVTILVSIAFALGLFVLAPFYLARIFIQQKGIAFNLLDGLFRAAIFVGYIAAMQLFADMRRTFQYHGAEHKAIACYEHGKKLNVKTVRRFAKEHPRCGTSFVVIVVLVSIIVFSLIKTQSTGLNILFRLLAMPLVAGLSYEVLKISAMFENSIPMKIVAAPGILIQKITTKEPSVKQIDVAIAAVKKVVANQH